MFHIVTLLCLLVLCFAAVFLFNKNDKCYNVMSIFLSFQVKDNFHPCDLTFKLEVCGYSIFATRPVPVAQDRYPYPYPTRTQNYYPTRPVPAGIPVPVRPSLSSVSMH